MYTKEKIPSDYFIPFTQAITGEISPTPTNADEAAEAVEKGTLAVEDITIAKEILSNEVDMIGYDLDDGGEMELQRRQYLTSRIRRMKMMYNRI